MTDIDLDFDEDLEDITAAIEADEADRRESSRTMPTPAVGSGGGAWRLAGGGVLDGHVTRVQGRTVHATHTSTCGRCSGRGGSNGWPGFTCYRCSGSKVEVRSARLYAPHQVEAIAQAKERRREALRQRHLARVSERRTQVREVLARTLAEHAPLFDLIERTRAVTRDAFVADVVAKVHQYGTVSDRQAAFLRKACGALVELDDQRRTSRPVGAVGDRPDLEVTCQRIRATWFDNPATFKQERVYLVTYRDRSGAVFLNKARREPDHGEGDVLLLRGTVKAHKEYDGVTQTVLIRTNVLKLIRTTTIEQALRAADEAGDHDETHAPTP